MSREALSETGGRCILEGTITEEQKAVDLSGGNSPFERAKC